MDEQQPKSESVTVIDGAPGETNTASGRTDELANPFGLLRHQYIVTAEGAWTSEQRQAIQRDLSRRAQVMRERLDTFLDQLRAERSANGAMVQAEEQADTTGERVLVDDAREQLLHTAGFLTLNVREAGERLGRDADKPTKN